METCAEPDDGDPDDEGLARLFAEFLKAADEGRDIAAELLARAGELRAPLEAKIKLARRMRELTRAPGTDEKSPDAPRLFGRFEILGTLGKTGLSRVYLAYDPKLGRRIALKVLDRERLLDKDQEAWILNEARSLAKLEHGNVVAVYEVGVTDTHAYVVMELLTGPSLAAVIAAWARQRGDAATGGDGKDLVTEEARLRAERLRPYSARIECLARLAEALAHCHDHGILHRDIKPANVLFDGEGNPKLIDFGLAHLEGAEEDTKLGLTQQLVGTAGYIAPEQVESNRTGADPRSDQFAFGTLAYECFALRNPFLGKGRAATLDAIVRAEPPSLASKEPSLPPDLPRVIHHALARDPAARYPSLAALATDLRAILANRPVSVEDPSLAHVARLWLRRHRRGVAVASAVTALALGTWISAWIATTSGERNRLSAELESIRPATFEDPDELDKAYEPLQELQRRAREFDSGLFRTAFFGLCSPEVDEVVQAWSLRLSEMHARDRKRSEESGIALQDMIYRLLMWEDENLCPTCSDNAEGRLRGRVLFPEDLLVGRQHSLARLTPLELEAEDPRDPRATGPFLFKQHVLSAFRATPLLDLLVAGTYRLQVREETGKGLWYETVFHVPEGWRPGIRVRLVRPREELWKRSVPVEGVQPALPAGLGTLTIPSFRVLETPISVAEFERFLAETDEPASGFLGDCAPGDSAAVSFEMAMRYAAWAGGRLPSYAELVVAEKAEAIPLSAQSERIKGEFVQDRSGPHEELLDPVYLSYASGEPKIWPGRELLHGVIDVGASSPKYCCFRVAFSTDDPELYDKLAREPIEK